MKILRAFQVINKDGVKSISSVFYEVDENGNITNENGSDNFIAVDKNLVEALNVVESHIKSERLGGD